VYDGSHWNRPTEVFTLKYTDNNQRLNLVGLAGRFAIAWRQSISEESSIFARVFDVNNRWGNVTSLEHRPGEAYEPSMAVSPLSGITVAWNQLDPTGNDLTSYTNTHDGLSWTGEASLTLGNYYVGSSHYPQLLTNENGKTLAIWIQDRIGKNALYANIHQDGAWGTPTLLGDSITYVHQQIATDGYGFAVLWQATNDTIYYGLTYSIYVKVYNGDGWNSTEALGESLFNRFTGVTPASIASNGDGYVVVYRTYKSLELLEEIYARYYDGVVWRAPILLSDSEYDLFRFTKIVTNGRTYLSIWSQFDGKDVVVYSSEYDGSSWSTPLTTDIQSNGYIDRSLINYRDIPCLVSNGQNYLAVWLEGENVMGNFYSSSWGMPFQIGEDTLNAWHRPDTPHVTSNGIGYAVAWPAHNDVRELIKANIYDGNRWSGTTDIYQDDVYLVNFDMLGHTKQLASAGNNYAVLWGAYDGTTSNIRDIYASVYDGIGWSSPHQLDDDSGTIAGFELADNGEDFLAAWLQDNGTGDYDVITNRNVDTVWHGPQILDVNKQSAFDLNLIGNWDGFRAIWTQPEPDGDRSIRFPWARLRF
jgi:hypothetical protein